MAQQVQPDLLYLKSREDLLLYEDSRTNALFNGTANFYLTRNDQSIFGAFFRALAKELARLEYDYAYDLVGKEPQFLTPPDIKRRWSDPLFISGAYPATTPNDLPTGQSDLSYRNMLVELLAAYKEGATVKAITDVIFAYTGITVVVQELYKLIGNGIFDQSDRNALRISVNVGGNNPLLDITTLNQLQLIVNSLYTAIDLTKPAHVGLEFTTVFGSDENIDDYTKDISFFPYPHDQFLPGISDNLTVIFRLIEAPPFSPMLYQAPILNPNPVTTKPFVASPWVSTHTYNPGDTASVGGVSYIAVATSINQPPPGAAWNSLPTQTTTYTSAPTTLASYGRQFAGPLLTISAAAWAALPNLIFNVTNTVADGNNATFSFNSATIPLVDGMQVTILGMADPRYNITGKISHASGAINGTFTIPLALTIASAADAGTGLVTPTIQAAYAKDGANYTVGMANWSALSPFFQGQIITDTNGNTQMALNTGTSGATMPTFTFVLSQSEGLFSGSTKYDGTITGGANNAYAGRTFTVTGFGNPDNNGIFFCLASTATSITLNNVTGVAELAVASAATSAWSLTLNGSTTDGGVTWRMVGFGQIYNPSYKWIMLLQPGIPSIVSPLPPTGEIGNWDINHPMGLVAPRLGQAWEISGGDTFQSFEMN